MVKPKHTPEELIVIEECLKDAQKHLLDARKSLSNLINQGIPRYGSLDWHTLYSHICISAGGLDTVISNIKDIRGIKE